MEREKKKPCERMQNIEGMQKSRKGENIDRQMIDRQTDR